MRADESLAEMSQILEPRAATKVKASCKCLVAVVVAMVALAWLLEDAMMIDFGLQIPSPCASAGNRQVYSNVICPHDKGSLEGLED